MANINYDKDNKNQLFRIRSNMTNSRKTQKDIKNKSSYKIKKKIIKLGEFNSLDWKIKDNKAY